MAVRKYFVENLVYPFMEVRKGNKIRHYLEELKKSQYYSTAELKELQESKLRRLLLHCIYKVPAYQSFRSLESLINTSPGQALSLMPVLTKSAFSQNSNRYLTDGIEPDKLIANRTGGSTGEPIRFYIDRVTVEHFEAARWRGLSWWGITPGDPSVMIWGSPIELSQSQGFKFRVVERFLKNRIVIPAYSLNPANIKQYLNMIERFSPSYIYGYASSLFVFARLMSENGLKLKTRLKGVVSTAESLYQHQRVVIEEAFEAPTINEYGARDGGIIAYECPRGNMHLSDENQITEILDINTGKPAETGAVVITDLNNFSMPRLRCQIGDIAQILPQPCACGRGLQVLGEIEGRVDDIFVSQKGNLIHGHYWNHIARNMEGIRQFQLIQHHHDSLSLFIVKGPRFDEQEVKHFIMKINEALGPIEIKVDYAEEIPTSPSGKTRYAIRDFPLTF